MAFASVFEKQVKSQWMNYTSLNYFNVLKLTICIKKLQGTTIIWQPVFTQVENKCNSPIFTFVIMT
jgi:hypothetical protein